MQELLLAIDAGTGSCRAVVFDLDGRQLAIGQREYHHPELPGAPGSQVFDTETNWRLICACVREALRDIPPEAVRALSATSMREGMVLYDRGGAEIWACPNADGRAGLEIAEMVRSGEAREIYRRAGDWVAITAPPRLRWIARHQPDVFASIAHVSMLGDWILHRLTGEFVTDPSLGSSSGMFDLADRDWSGAILDLCGLDRAPFPSVVAPGTAIGAVTARAAEETGLAAGTPVVVGGADTQLSLVGIGVADPGRVSVVGGTFWQTTAMLDEPLIDPQARLRTLCHTAPERWMIEGIGFYCGLVMRWYRDAFCAAELEAARQAGEDVYDILERGAATIPPGSNGVWGIFSNVMQADRWVHASPALLGFNLSEPNTARAQGLRAIEESAAYVARGHVEIIEELIRSPVTEIVFTGGASQGTLWPQILANVLGVPLRIPEVHESTALGAAICAGVGVGLYDDAVVAARRLVRFPRTVDPDPAVVAQYSELYERWRTIYAASLELAERGLTRPLWRAAGA